MYHKKKLQIGDDSDGKFTTKRIIYQRTVNRDQYQFANNSCRT